MKPSWTQTEHCCSQEEMTECYCVVAPEIPFYQNPSKSDVVARSSSILTESISREICLIDSSIPLRRLWRAKGNFHWGGIQRYYWLIRSLPPAEYFSGEAGPKWQEEIAHTLTLHRKCVSSLATTEEKRDLKWTIERVSLPFHLQKLLTNGGLFLERILSL